MLSDLELALLSLIAEGSRYGYEIEAAIDERGLRDWLTVGSASFYYVLRRLEHQALITRTSNADVAPEQDVYCISEAGSGVLQTAIVDRLRQPPPLGAGVELALAALHVLKPAQVYTALARRRVELRAAISSDELALASRDPLDVTVALYAHRITLMRAEIDWLDDFISTWRSRYPAVEQEAADAGDNDLAGENVRTQVHPPTSPDRAKQMQSLRRPKTKS
jgi:DNA-binding PadR family transcriptional regulator